MASVDVEVNELKARVELAMRKKVRAEADKDGARKAANTALKQLTDQFEVSSVEEAKSLMLKMQAELSDAVSQVRQSLDSLDL